MKTLVGLLLFIVSPLCAYAQVADLPVGPYGGQFRDQATGKIWLDNDAISGTFAAKNAFLANTPFRMATSADLQSILQENIIRDPAVGPFSRCILFGNATMLNCKLGVFDDSGTGTNPTLAGLMGVDEEASGLVFENDRVSNGSSALTGTWVIQRGPALRGGSDPFAADFDGDGKDEKIVWRPSEGNWYVRFSGTDEMMTYQWGLPGDIPLVGDYDGDLIPDLVVWRPSNGTWYVKTSKSLFDASQAVMKQFGLPGDVPMKGDFDGDGKLDFVVWRPKEGNWYVFQSSNGQAVVTQWGLAKDIPVTGGRG